MAANLIWTIQNVIDIKDQMKLNVLFMGEVIEDESNRIIV